MCFCFSQYAAVTDAAIDPTQLQYQEIIANAESEEWARVEVATAALDANGCPTENFFCLYLLTVRAEYFYISARPERAERLLNFIGQSQLQGLTAEQTRDVREAADIVRAVGLRHRGQRFEGKARLTALVETPLTLRTMARARGELGYLNLQMGFYQDAILNYEISVRLSQEAEDENLHSFAEVGLALVEKAKGRYARSIAMLESIVLRLQILSSSKHLRRLGFIHGNLGSIYKQLGRYSDAMKEYQLARQYGLRADPVAFRASWLDMIASAHRLQGDHGLALGIIQNTFLPYVNQPSRLYFAHRELALNYAAVRDWRNATNEIATAIKFRLQAGVHTNIGEYFADQGVFLKHQSLDERALDSFLEGLRWSEQQQEPESVWKNTYGLFRHYRERGNRTTAIYWGKKTVNAIQTIRDGIVSLNDSAQNSYIQHISYVYQDLATELIADGRLVESEQILLMLKIRETKDHTSGIVQRTAQPEEQIGFIAAEQRVFAEFEGLRVKAVEMSAELNFLEIQRRSGFITVEEESRRAQLVVTVRESLKSWRTALEAWSIELFSQSSAIRGKHEVEREANTLISKSNMLRSLIKGAPIGTVALQYSQGEHDLGIVLTVQGLAFGYTVPIKRVELNKMISNLRLRMNNRQDIAEVSRALWKILISPVESEILAAKADTLVLSLTDSLRYLPFAALQKSDGRYLIEDYAVAHYAAAGGVRLASPITPWNIAAFGVTRAGQAKKREFAALPAVKREIETVVAAMSSYPSVTASIRLDETFDRASLELVLEGSHNVVHIASHFDFRAGDRNGSVLILGAKGSDENSTLSLNDLEEFNFGNLEQITLSACDTAIGGILNGNGIEVESLSTIMLTQKARSVLATLWKVADASTAEIMSRFYGQIATSPVKVTRAEALRRAQLILLRGVDVSGLQLVKEERAARRVGGSRSVQVEPAKHPWVHPYYWAPFVLSGNWL